MDIILHTFGQELPKNETSNHHRTGVFSVLQNCLLFSSNHIPTRVDSYFCNGGWMERGGEGGFHPRI